MVLLSHFKKCHASSSKGPRIVQASRLATPWRRLGDEEQGGMKTPPFQSKMIYSLTSLARNIEVRYAWD